MAKTMEERMKVIEKKVKVLEKTRNKILLQAVETTDMLLARVKDLEEHLTSLDWASDGNGNHPEDEGWFD